MLANQGIWSKIGLDHLTHRFLDFLIIANGNLFIYSIGHSFTTYKIKAQMVHPDQNFLNFPLKKGLLFFLINKK